MLMPEPATALRPAVSGAVSRVQRKCSCGGSCDKCKAEKSDEEPGHLQMKPADGGVSRHASAPPIAPPIIHEVLRSPGQPLDAATRNFMEPRFGHDFSHVRVHTDATAAESASAVNARAYTVGNHVAFAAGQYSSNNERSRHLLAHELSHVLQQDSKSTISLQRTCGESAIAAKVKARGGCTDNFDDTFLWSLPEATFRFKPNCDEFAPGEEIALITFVAGLPATTTLEIHGFASFDGPRAFNENLGCARAEAAFSLITTDEPTRSSRVTAVVNHGPVKSPKDPVENLRSVVIRTHPPEPKPVPPKPPPPATLQTVTLPTRIRGAATPSVMPHDRIPPRVDTPVEVTFGGTPDVSAPVTLSIDGMGGGNGSAIVGPYSKFAITGTETVNLKGADQTDPGKAGNLKLIARQRGSLLAESAGFSVSAIPQNVTMAFRNKVEAPDPDFRGVEFLVFLESDSTEVADLDQSEFSERIEVASRPEGSLAMFGIKSSCYLACKKIWPDKNAVPASVRGEGKTLLKQTFMFWDKRTGAKNVPMTKSGFLIYFGVSSKAGTSSGFQVIVTKAGKTTDALDPNPDQDCAAGRVPSTAGIGETSKSVDI